jgi:hypothetical protein
VVLVLLIDSLRQRDFIADHAVESRLIVSTTKLRMFGKHPSANINYDQQ